jgi:hypothetical protein
MDGSSGDGAAIRQTRQRALEVGAVVAKGSRSRVRLHIYHDIQRTRVQTERLALTAVNLARPTLQPVANDRFAALLRRGDSEPRVRQLVAGSKEDAIAGEEFAPRFVNAKKLAALGESLLFRQRLGQRMAAGSDGKALAALAATAREHRLAIFGTHTDEKAVRALAAAVVRLKSTLHDYLTL